MCISRIVCFFCGTSPVGAGVSLSLCGGCHCVAYCSRNCQVSDWAEHRRECKRKEVGVSETGLQVLPATGLEITRALTELKKPRSMKVELPGTPPELSIRRTVATNKDGLSIPLPMAWSVEFNPKRRL